MSAEFEQRVIFEPGYNYLHETGPRRRGQHGMRIRFLLIGSEGTTVFLMGTGWTPLGEVDKGATHNEPCHIDAPGLRHYSFGSGHYGMVNAPSGYDLGFHWKRPAYEGQDVYADSGCTFLDDPTSPCYYDGSGLAADDLLRDFIAKGESAVWAKLRDKYAYYSEQAALVASAVQP